MQLNGPQHAWHQCPRPQPPCLSRRLSATYLSQQVGVAQVLGQITAFALVPVPVRFCMHYLRVKTISSSLAELPKLSPTGFQSQRLRGLMESTFLSWLFPQLEPRSSCSCSEHFSQLFCKVRAGPGCQFFCRAQHSPGQTEILCWTLSVDQVFDEGLCKDSFSFSFHAQLLKTPHRFSVASLQLSPCILKTCSPFLRLPSYKLVIHLHFVFGAWEASGGGEEPGL